MRHDNSSNYHSEFHDLIVSTEVVGPGGGGGAAPPGGGGGPPPHQPWLGFDG